MPVEVLVLSAGGADLLMRWMVRGAASAASDHWEELHRKLFRAGTVKAAEVYFCYNGPPFENHDRELIAALTAASKQHAPDARQHAVFDVHTITGLDLPDELDAVAGWYVSASRGGLDDILELRLDRESEAVLPRLLRAACARSEQRTSVIARLSNKHGRWSAVFAEREPFLSKGFEGILDPYVRYGLPSGTGDPVVIVVRDPQRDVNSQTQSVLVERVLEEQRHPPGVVIALLGCYAEGDLKTLCQREQLDFLHFHGFLELRYFLLQLNSGPEAAAENRARELPRSEGDRYSRYKAAIDQLRATFQAGDSRYGEFLAYELRLLSSIETLRQNGTSENEQARLNEVLSQLNRLTQDVLGVSFNSLLYPAGPASAR